VANELEMERLKHDQSSPFNWYWNRVQQFMADESAVKDEAAFMVDLQELARQIQGAMCSLTLEQYNTGVDFLRQELYGEYVPSNMKRLTPAEYAAARAALNCALPAVAPGTTPMLAQPTERKLKEVLPWVGVAVGAATGIGLLIYFLRPKPKTKRRRRRR
jgi:hypothetical protein